MAEYKKITGKYVVTSNDRIGPKTFMMCLEGDTTPFTRPGQFVNVSVPGKFLKRPISVCDYSDSKLTLLYDVVGSGTTEMSQFIVGTSVDLLIALGNGFDVDASGTNPLLLGGGIGIAPLYGLAKELVARGVLPTVILGFNRGEDVIMEQEFRALCPTYIATVDGSAPSGPDGDINVTKGFVTDVIDRYNLGDASYYYACGPLPMLKALSLGLDIPGELSMESRMGCGFGICVCC
ncbi:MAG: dihydroorotate dehydrogenase electron transfer subunit, partial [Muribaculaceae bacterium]|nr:dihydroorotate dehydrogenase electron transfer subunit [Muribaculaceae bacterium]